MPDPSVWCCILLFFIGHASFFLCFSLCARIDFRQSPKKKTQKLSALCCVESHPDRLCVSAPAPSPPFDDLLVEPYNFQHFQRTKIRREAQSEAKSSEKKRGGKKTDGYRCGCDMAGRLLIVLIGEDSRAFPESEQFLFFDSQLYERASCCRRHDRRQIAHGLCELAQGVIHPLQALPDSTHVFDWS